MFQYEFFSLKDIIPHLPPKAPLPKSFTRLDDLLWIRSSYWAEHCLECGEPLCYETCPHFRPRFDGRCRLFRYGIFSSPYFADAPYRAQLRFRRWGKMETILYPGSFSPQEAMQVHDDWKARCLEKCRIMHMGAYGRKKYPIEERRKFDSEKYIFSGKAASKNIQKTPWFLLQAYSYEKKPFVLFFDVTDDADLAFREGITIMPGYNQRCLDMRTLFPPKGRLRAKFYPADNTEAELVFLFCEFVQLKPGIFPQTYPAQHTPSAPASKVKCVAWDLDGTVWDGILIESDPDALALRPAVADTMEQLDQRGILQIVLSKNNLEDVLPVLQRLGIDRYFVYILANWNAKSANLKQAADLLNIGLDSFALIDDSAFERGEVIHALPMVRAYPETAVADGLFGLSEFDVPVTNDSRARRQMYQTEAKRKTAAQASQGNSLDFLRSCELTATLKKPSTEEEILRSYELLLRTNQLNLSGKKYDQKAFFSHIRTTDHFCFILSCQDRFGSYGQVAYLEACLCAEEKTLRITEFAMSCRVAGKFVEAALIKALFSCFPEQIGTIELVGTKTSRNELLIRSFCTAGFSDLCREEQIRLVYGGSQLLQNTDIVSIQTEL